MHILIDRHLAASANKYPKSESIDFDIKYLHNENESQIHYIAKYIRVLEHYKTYEYWNLKATPA